MQSTEGWKPVWAVTLSLLATVAGADLALRELVSPRAATAEAWHGVAAVAEGDPEVLVLGSSFAGSFAPLEAALATRRGAAPPVAVVPVAWGTATTLYWTWAHRLSPLLDAASHGPARAVLVLSMWDLCATRDGAPHRNLPARAWGPADFVADVRAEGLTPYNHHFVKAQAERLVADSLLLSDRGWGRIWEGLAEQVHPTPPAVRAERQAALLARRRAEVESGDGLTCPAARERRALGLLLDDLAARGVQTTIVVYPLAPGTVSDRARRETLGPVRHAFAELAAPRGLPLVDLSEGAPLALEDYEPDLLHVRPERWAPLVEHALRSGLAPALPAVPGGVALGDGDEDAAAGGRHLSARVERRLDDGPVVRRLDDAGP